MTAVLGAFLTIALVVVLGVVVAQIGLVNYDGQRMLGLLSFNVATPALLITVLEESDPAEVLSGPLLATAAGVAGVVAIVVAAAAIRRVGLGDSVIATLSASYVNAGNLGLPVAAYALGDAALVVPAMLLQLLVLQPIALTLLDVATRPGRPTIAGVLTRPLTNPITIATLFGLFLAFTGLQLPAVVHRPLELVAGMAVPAMLIAYGVSLRLGPLPGRGVNAKTLGGIVVLKMVAQPLITVAVAGPLLGIEGTGLFAVTLLASLPTAQNIYVIATRYRSAELLARDSVFVTTMLSVPVAVVIAAFLA